MKRILKIKDGHVLVDLQGNIEEVYFKEENYDYLEELIGEYLSDLKVIKDEHSAAVSLNGSAKVYIDGVALIIYEYKKEKEETNLFEGLIYDENESDEEEND